MISLIACICLLSCTETHQSGIKHESGTVVAVQYKAATDQTIEGSSYNFDHGRSWHTQNIKEDERFMVVFKCDHGVVFSINNSAVFGKVRQYDKVDIAYKELLTEENQVIDIDFVDANPIK